MKPKVAALLFFTCLFLAIFVNKFSSNSQDVQFKSIEQSQMTTEKFIENLDISRYERNGSDFNNYRFSQKGIEERLGKPVKQINITYDYDFEHLAMVEERLKEINRKEALKAIFDQVTQGASTNLEKHLALLKFLQKSSYHGILMQPMYSDKSIVFDPLVLLELGEMRCGQVSRIAVDLFDSAGYEGRIVQVGSHVLAEVAYDNSYHYLDADLFGGGESVIKAGRIPSIAELSENPYLIDSLGGNRESSVSNNKTGEIYPSYYYFHEKAYRDSEISAIFYEKIASVEESNNKLYGWNYYANVADSERELLAQEQPVYYIPDRVDFVNISVMSNISKSEQSSILNLEWLPAKDLDDDLLGYKVFVSEQSRGWNRTIWGGRESLREFNNNEMTWQPYMYDKFFKEPPHDVLLTETKEAIVNLDLAQGKDYYITVMPYDEHGESVGRVLYPMSNEIKVSL